jgi:hypothetical protein
VVRTASATGSAILQKSSSRIHEPGPLAGSCGTAVHLGRQVVAADVASDPRWKPFREPASSPSRTPASPDPYADRRVSSASVSYDRDQRAAPLESVLP